MRELEAKEVTGYLSGCWGLHCKICVSGTKCSGRMGGIYDLEMPWDFTVFFLHHLHESNSFCLVAHRAQASLSALAFCFTRPENRRQVLGKQSPQLCSFLKCCFKLLNKHSQNIQMKKQKLHRRGPSL